MLLQSMTTVSSKHGFQVIQAPVFQDVKGIEQENQI